MEHVILYDGRAFFWTTISREEGHSPRSTSGLSKSSEVNRVAGGSLKVMFPDSGWSDGKSFLFSWTYNLTAAKGSLLLKSSCMEEPSGNRTASLQESETVLGWAAGVMGLVDVLSTTGLPSNRLFCASRSALIWSSIFCLWFASAILSLFLSSAILILSCSSCFSRSSRISFPVFLLIFSLSSSSCLSRSSRSNCFCLRISSNFFLAASISSGVFSFTGLAASVDGKFSVSSSSSSSTSSGWATIQSMAASIEVTPVDNAFLIFFSSNPISNNWLWRNCETSDMVIIDEWLELIKNGQQWLCCFSCDVGRVTSLGFTSIMLSKCVSVRVHLLTNLVRREHFDKMDNDLEDAEFLRQKIKRRDAVMNSQFTGFKFELKSNKQPEKVNPSLKGMRHEVVDKPEEQTAEEQEMNIIMGFSTFGPKKKDKKDDTKVPTTRQEEAKPSTSRETSKEDKKPRYFTDLTSLVNESISTARQLIANNEDALDHKLNDDEDNDSEDEISPSLPEGYKPDSDDEDDVVGPPLPPGFLDQQLKTKKSEEHDSDFSDDDESGQEAVDRYSFPPVDNDIVLQHGTKTVSALAIDHNGARVVSGGYDYEIRIWDFASMDHYLEPLRGTTPFESHPINCLDWSASGEHVLAAAGTTQAKVLDRDGYVKGTSVKGDQYIRDMSNTKGHTALLNSCLWHPKDREQFLTCSNDGTLRIWTVDDMAKKQKTVIKPRNQGGLRAIPNSLAASRDGHFVAVGCSDGSIQGWDLRKNTFVNTSLLLRNCHAGGNEVSSIKFSYTDNLLCSRSMDDTMKIWDLRNTKECLHTWDDLFNRFAMTDCAFSPDDKMVLTGISAQKNDPRGSLVFYSTTTFEKVKSIEFKSSVVRCLWHPRINQVACSLSDGNVKVFFDDDRSERGAKLCVGRVRKKVVDSFMISEPQIITPHALPMFKEEKKKSWKVQQMKDRKDPVKSRKPEVPQSGPGAGGRIMHAGSTYASYIAKNIAVKNKLDDTMDPREALLRHAEEAAKNPYWVAPAYAQTQPKPVFRKLEEDEEEDESSKKHKPCWVSKPAALQTHVVPTSNLFIQMEPFS